MPLKSLLSLSSSSSWAPGQCHLVRCRAGMCNPDLHGVPPHPPRWPLSRWSDYKNSWPCTSFFLFFPFFGLVLLEEPIPASGQADLVVFTITGVGCPTLLVVLWHQVGQGSAPGSTEPLHLCSFSVPVVSFFTYCHFCLSCSQMV